MIFLAELKYHEKKMNKAIEYASLKFRQEMESERTAWIAAFKEGDDSSYLELFNAPEYIQNDQEMVLEAVKQDGYALEHTSQRAQEQ